jgi:methylisocitrate lyase
MARTDALAVEGIDKAIERAIACVEAGADMIFPEAITELAMYRRFKDAVKVPVLANITEFGQTPLVHARRAGLGGRRHRAALLFRLSGDECRGARHLPGDPPRRYAKERAGSDANARRSYTSTSTITRTKPSLDELFAVGKEK